MKTLFATIIKTSFLFCLLTVGHVMAAEVNLSATIQVDKLVYRANDTALVTVRIANRGPSAASAAKLEVQVPGVLLAQQGFNIAGIICTPSLAAVCPTAYTHVVSSATNQLTDRLLTTIPELPRDSSMQIQIAVKLSAPFGRGSKARVEIIPSGTQVLGSNAVNIGDINFSILPLRSQYEISAQRVNTGDLIPSRYEVFDLTIRSTGEDPVNLLNLELVASERTGTNTAPQGSFITRPQILAISCISASGGASCNDIVGKSAAGSLELAQPQVNVAESNVIFKSAMPGTLAVGVQGSSIVMRVTVDAPIGRCSSAMPLPSREMLLTSSIFPTDANEIPFTNTNNSTTSVVSAVAQRCNEGSLLVRSLTEQSAQQIAGINPQSGFAYEAVYEAGAANTGTANDVGLSWSMSWPGATGVNLSSAVICTPTGGAACPTSYAITQTKIVSASDPEKVLEVVSSLTAVSPAMPAGSSIKLSFTGTSGPDNTSICKPLAAKLRTEIKGASINFVETSTPADNSLTLSTTANVGYACGPSHEVAATVSGPWLDRAGTQAAPQPLQPGQIVHFKSVYSNLAAGADLTRYVLTAGASNFSGLGTNFTASDNDGIYGVQQAPGEPKGYDYFSRFQNKILDAPTGVTCEASGGATCQTAPFLNGTNGNDKNYTKWVSGSREPNDLFYPNPSFTQPIWPVGGVLTYTTSIRVPGINKARGTTCIGNTETVISLRFDAEIYLNETSPPSPERDLVPNSQSVPFSVRIPPCNNSLAVTKTLLAPATASSIPASGLVNYKIVVQNTSAQNLDLPRLIDAVFFPDGVRITNISCSAVNSLAVCPSFVPVPGMKRLADGSMQTLNLSGNVRYANQVPLIDFVWGSPGANTMPAGSSLTFNVTLQAGSNVTSIRNTAYFTAAESAVGGPWPQVTSFASLSLPSTGKQLIVQKTVNQVRAVPGSTITYTIDAFNDSASEIVSPVLLDTMPEGLAALNPNGFTAITCRALTAADNVLVDPASPVSCPPINSDATGLRAQFGTLPSKSGVRISFTARAPLTSTFNVSNTARFVQDENKQSIGDSSSTANFITRNIGAVQGTVWRDFNRDRSISASEPRIGGIRVEVLQNGVVVGSAMTDPITGEYRVDDLLEGSYDIRFVDAAGNTIIGRPKSADPTCTTCNGDTNSGLIRGVTISTGISRVNQDLPIDPSGVVYDAVTRLPVGGAVVTLIGPNNLPVPAACVVGGVNPQTTSLTAPVPGGYQFDVLFTPGCPGNGNYSLSIVPPGGYTSPSALIPVNPGSFNPAIAANCQPGSIIPGNCLVQTQSSAPDAGAPTQYWFSFSLSSGGNGVANNHIPLDPTNSPLLLISKSANLSTVELGGNVRYTIKVTYASGTVPLPVLRVLDTMPPGFKLIEGTSFVKLPSATAVQVPLARISGAPGAVVTYNLPVPVGGFLPGNVAELTYRVRVGVGSMQGDGINRAQAFSSGTVRSNVAQARVKVNPGVFTNNACVVGKIYVDCNNNHMQDAEELGIPGVRMFLSDGTFLVSDSEGKYSICGLEPKSHVLKVDTITLPRGSRLTTTSNRNLGNADSVWLDMKNGEMQQADFVIGSCSNTVLEQVKARRAKGGVRTIENEPKDGAALKFEGKSAVFPDQGTDSANQNLLPPRPPAAPPPQSDAENNTPVPQLPAASSNTRGNNIRDAK